MDNRMMEQSYRVAGHVFSLKMEEGDTLWTSLGNYAPFIYEGSDERIFTLELVPSLEYSSKKDFFVASREERMPRLDIYSIDGGYLIEMAPFGNVPVSGRLAVSSDFSRGRLMVTKNNRFYIDKSLMLMYTFRTAEMGTMEMHASVTVKDGRGFLFLGKSGTGKSTHSQFWLKNIAGTHLLNDDNPVVRTIDGKVWVYGSPWSGKTPCYRNEEYPVGAFVKIKQAPHNKIHRLSPLESFAAVSSSTSGLRAIRSVTDSLFATISSVVESVPCYLLECLPDDEAARVCSEEVLKD